MTDLHPAHEHDITDAALMSVLEVAAIEDHEAHTHDEQEDSDEWRRRVFDG